MDGGDAVRLGVDVGGTFTDVVLVAGGAVTTAKVPTTPDQSDGVVAGVEAACDSAGVEPADVDRFRHGTTASVNALLEREGAPTALVTTRGFGDVLAIGRQDRPALYDLDAEKPPPLVPRERRFELDERATPAGIEDPVDEAAVRDLAADVAATDAESVAVALLHAYASPDNEKRVADLLRAELDVPVSASNEVLPTFREYERTATTVADAYVRPVVDDYLGRLADRAADRGLPAPRVMQANGGIAAAETVRKRAVTTVLSGPAAGVVGAALFDPSGDGADGPDAGDPEGSPDDARDHDARDHDGIVTFDMGGTSSDVGLVRDGDIERTSDADIGGHPVRIPMVDVETVGAGGGSIARVDAGGALRVGPRSAGADPGPVCYGRGGTEPTVTDANLVLGYLGPDTRLGGGLELDAAAAESALADLAADAGLPGPRAAARGVYRVANATMTRAIRGVTVERGHDPREFAVVAFGGAGPMHAAALADRLGVGTVLVPRANGVLSALGLLAADEKHDAVRTRKGRLDGVDADGIEAVYADLAKTALADATDPSAATVERGADLRYAGQSFELTVEASDPFDPETVRERFHATHEAVRGYRMGEPVELVNLRATATIPGDPPALTHAADPGEPLVERRPAVFGDDERETPVYARERVPTGFETGGPAVFEGGESTVVLPLGWSVRVDDRGTLVVEGGS